MFAMVGYFGLEPWHKIMASYYSQELQSPIDSDQYLEGKTGK
jgi:hypothetical protein